VKIDVSCIHSCGRKIQNLKYFHFISEQGVGWVGGGDDVRGCYDPVLVVF
jgi:hypothetical protein